MKRAVAALALLAAFAPTVASHGAEEVTHKDQEIDARFVIDPFDFAELNMEVHPEETIEWSVEAGDSRPVKVDLHAHAAQGVVYLHQNNSTSHDVGSYTAEDHHEYSLAVYNPGSEPARVRLRVQGYFGLMDTLGFEIQDGEDSPGTPLSGAFVALAAALYLARRRR